MAFRLDIFTWNAWSAHNFMPINVYTFSLIYLNCIIFKKKTTLHVQCNVFKQIVNV